MQRTRRTITVPVIAIIAAALIPFAAHAQEFDDDQPAGPIGDPAEGTVSEEEGAPADAPSGDIPVERPYQNQPPSVDGAPTPVIEGVTPPPAPEHPPVAPPPAAKAGKTSLKKKKDEPQDTAIKVSLKVIYASKEQKSVDKRIADLAKGFQKEFKEYELSKFQLLEAKEFKIEPRVTLPIDLPGGKRLNLTNGGIKDKKVVLALDVPELIKTTVLVAPAGKFSFGGPKYRYGEGMIILVIKARPAGR